MDSFASSTSNEKAPSTSNGGTPSTSDNGASVTKKKANNISTIRIPSILGTPTEAIAIDGPDDKNAFNISILAEAILGPYTRSRALIHRRAFRTGLEKELRQLEAKIAKATIKYKEHHIAVHVWMDELRGHPAWQHVFPPAEYAELKGIYESQLADARVGMRETLAYIDSLRLKTAALKKLLWLNVLVRKGQLEALRLLLEIADWEPAVRELRFLIEEVERA